MDTSTADPQLLKSSLRFIRRVNAVLGYTRATISHLERFSRSWKKGYTIRMVDLATGSADVPRAILRWADRRGWDVRIVGVIAPYRKAGELSSGTRMAFFRSSFIKPQTPRARASATV